MSKVNFDACVFHEALGYDGEYYNYTFRDDSPRNLVEVSYSVSDDKRIYHDGP